MKSIFVSHVYEDGSYKDRVRQWASSGRLGNVVVTGESADVRQGGEGAIRRHLSPMLRGAGAVVVLVGDDTHNRDWVDYEVNHALSQGVRVIAMRIPGTYGAAPSALRGRNLVNFDPDSLRAALGS